MPSSCPLAHGPSLHVLRILSRKHISLCCIWSPPGTCVHSAFGTQCDMGAGMRGAWLGQTHPLPLGPLPLPGFSFLLLVVTPSLPSSLASSPQPTFFQASLLLAPSGPFVFTFLCSSSPWSSSSCCSHASLPPPSPAPLSFILFNVHLSPIPSPQKKYLMDIKLL